MNRDNDMQAYDDHIKKGLIRHEIIQLTPVKMSKIDRWIFSVGERPVDRFNRLRKKYDKQLGDRPQKV